MRIDIDGHQVAHERRVVVWTHQYRQNGKQMTSPILLNGPRLHGFGLVLPAQLTVRAYSRKSPGDPNYATAFSTSAATVYQAIALGNGPLLHVDVQDTSGGILVATGFNRWKSAEQFPESH